MSMTYLVRLSGVSALAVAGAVLAGSVSLGAAAAPEAPQPGSRICGRMYRAAPDPAHPDMVAQIRAIVIEVDKDSGRDICDKANSNIKSSIQKQDPNAKFDDQARQGPVNSWNKFEMMDCEDIGIYFANTSDNPSTDFCDKMNKSSAASGDQHVYNWVKVMQPPAALPYPLHDKLPGTVTVEQQ